MGGSISLLTRKGLAARFKAPHGDRQKMNSEKLFPRTRETVKQGIADGVAPGFVFGYWEKRDPDRFFLEAHGSRRVIPSPLPMCVDTVFDLASVTKVFSTAT